MTPVNLIESQIDQNFAAIKERTDFMVFNSFLRHWHNEVFDSPLIIYRQAGKESSSSE